VSSALDALLVPASRDVFTDPLNQSVQELWPIKIDGPLQWPTQDLNDF